MKIVKFNNKYYRQVNEIYKTSFPKEERYSSLNKLISYTKKNSAELYCLINCKTVDGFIYSIKYKDMIFILYLAINNKKRSCGNGSYLLRWYLDKYSDKNIYLNIDKINENAIDYNIREQRLKFYEKNGLYLTNYRSCEKDNIFNILSTKKEFDVKEYKLLDKFIAELLNEPVSEINKI